MYYSSNTAFEIKDNFDELTLGKGWNHLYAKKISKVYQYEDNGIIYDYVVVRRDDGKFVMFTNINNVWINQTKTADRLIQTNDKWVLTNANNETEIYNLLGKLISVSNKGNTITLTYESGVFDGGDETLRLENISLANGRYIDFVYTGTSIKIDNITDDTGRLWVFEYSNDGYNNLTSITYPDNTIKEFIYGENSSHANALTGINSRHDINSLADYRYITYQYDQDNRVFNEWKHPKDENGVDIKVEELTVNYSSNPNDVNERAITNSKGVTSTYTVEKNSDLWQIKSISGPGCSNCNSSGIIANVYDPDTNDLTSKTSNGKTTFYGAYDSQGRGETKEITRNYNTTDASTLTFTYDNARRLTRVTDQQGNYVQYTLDTEGNQLVENTYDTNNTLKKTLTQVFDDYDQIDTTTQSGVTNNMDYGSDGNLYTQTNGNNIVTDYSYDALNRLTQITQDLTATTVPTVNTITAFEYDTQDRVKKITDANGNKTLYEYDDLGRLTKLTSPDTGIDEFTYDEAGNVISKTIGSSQSEIIFKNGFDVITNTPPLTPDIFYFNYDAYNRPTAIDYPGTNLDVSDFYDQGNNGLNQLTSFVDSYSATSLTYDAFGNLTDKTQTISNINDSNIAQALIYTYGANNLLQSITYPSGLVVTYQYNNLNQIIQVSSINGQNTILISNSTYLPMGPLISMTLGNGTLIQSKDTI